MLRIRRLLLFMFVFLVPCGLFAQGVETLIGEGVVDEKTGLEYRSLLIDESNEEDDIPQLFVRIEILHHGELFQTIKINMEEGERSDEFGRVQVVDVDFDGHPDLMAHLGFFGTHANLLSGCWLWNVNQQRFKSVHNFGLLSNPVIDATHRCIFSQGYSSAVSVEYGRYVIKNGQLEQTGRLVQTYAEDGSSTFTEYLIKKGHEKELRRQVSYAKISAFWRYVVTDPS